MKKGISLIVLVITIIVMIIIAGAIIISLNSSNVITQANKAVNASDVANLRSALTLDYADIMAANNTKDAGTTYNKTTAEAKYNQTIKDAGMSSVATVVCKSETDLRPVLTVTLEGQTAQTY